jgi:hypothetical protein
MTDDRMDSFEDWWAVDSARRAIRMQEATDDPYDPFPLPEERRQAAVYFWGEALKLGLLDCC